MSKDTTIQNADTEQTVEIVLVELMDEEPTEEELRAFEVLKRERQECKGKALFDPGPLYCTPVPAGP